MSRIAPLVPVSLLVGWVLLVFSGSIGVGAANSVLSRPQA